MQKKLQTNTAEEILSTVYKPIEYVIDGLLAQGLYILAGSQKVGKLYEDNALGRITDEQFQMLSQGYVEEKKQLESDISELETIVAEMKTKSGSSKTFIELAKKFTDIQELTPEILHTFISKIEIHEKVKDETTGKKTQDIDIYFTHVGKMS